MRLNDLKSLTRDQLASLGFGQVGYIRVLSESADHRYELRSADGEALATADTLEAALFAARHLDIEPVALH
jgi:hypothetical protein